MHEGLVKCHLCARPIDCQVEYHRISELDLKDLEDSPSGCKSLWFRNYWTTHTVERRYQLCHRPPPGFQFQLPELDLKMDGWAHSFLDSAQEGPRMLSDAQGSLVWEGGALDTGSYGRDADAWLCLCSPVPVLFPFWGWENHPGRAESSSDGGKVPNLASGIVLIILLLLKNDDNESKRTFNEHLLYAGHHSKHLIN